MGLRTFGILSLFTQHRLRRGLLAFVTGSYMANCVSMIVLTLGIKELASDD